MGSTTEIKRLQSCINDLISVLALPAIWSGSESSQILGTLLDVLLTMLRLDFAYARLGDASEGPPIEVVRLSGHRHSSVQPRQFGQALDRWLTDDQTASRCVVPDPMGEGAVSIASFSLGLQHEVGVLVAGSRELISRPKWNGSSCVSRPTRPELDCKRPDAPASRSGSQSCSNNESPSGPDD